MRRRFVPLVHKAATGHGDYLGKSPSRRYLLLVDADEQSRAWYRGRLRGVGHDVGEAGDVATAIALLERHRRAVVLTHVSTLPRADGARLREYLTQHREFAVITTTTPRNDLLHADDQDTARFPVLHVHPGSGGT